MRINAPHNHTLSILKPNYVPFTYIAYMGHIHIKHIIGFKYGNIKKQFDSEWYLRMALNNNCLSSDHILAVICGELNYDTTTMDHQARAVRRVGRTRHI